MKKAFGAIAASTFLAFLLLAVSTFFLPSNMSFADEVNSPDTSLEDPGQNDGEAAARSTKGQNVKDREGDLRGVARDGASTDDQRETDASQTQQSKPVVVESGVCGTCNWSIDSRGTLTLAPSKGESGTLELESDQWPWLNWKDSIVQVNVKEGVVAGEDCRGLFKDCSMLEYANLSHLDTSHAIKMSSMFEGCVNLVSVDLSSFDTSKTTSFFCMFRDCESLTSLDLSSLNTSKVKTMSFMFSGCTRLRVLDLSSFDLSSISVMRYMFADVWLDTFAVGKGWNPIGAIQQNCWPASNSSSGKWWSVDERCWYSEEAVLERAGVADTYTSRVDLSLVEFEPLAEQSWLGEAQTPIPTAKVRNESGYYALQNDVDFTITYKNNESVGTATMLIEGKGDYEGNREMRFTIIPSDLSNATISPIGEQKYTGEAVEPKPEVILDSVTLTEGRDYDLSYANNVEPGTATITITGSVGFSGKNTVTFTIGSKPGTWEKTGSQWRYRRADGSYPTSETMVIDGKTYRFDESGIMRTGWIQEGDATFWHDSSGVMAIGWKTISGLRYWFDSQGRRAVGWKEIDGNTYYFKPSGEATIGWEQIEGSLHWFDPEGRMATGWKTISNELYYFDSKGTPATGWREIDGSTYYFRPSGAMATGWESINGSWHWFDANGQVGNGWQKISGSWFWLNQRGEPATGWKEIDGSTYYFMSSGKMATEWETIDGSWYWFGSSGVKSTGWQKISGSWYWLGNDGIMETGWKELDDKWYYLKPSGVMTTNWQKIKGSWYWFGSSGVMATDWNKVSGSWYWFGTDGGMKTGWQKIDYSWYYLNSSGSMVTGWQRIGGKWYHFGSSGRMSVSRWIGESYVGGDGAMLVNARTPGGYWVDGNGIRIYFWVPGGQVYHKDRYCRSLSRSSDIRSGSIAESGKSRSCDICF